MIWSLKGKAGPVEHKEVKLEGYPCELTPPKDYANTLANNKLEKIQYVIELEGKKHYYFGLQVQKIALKGDILCRYMNGKSKIRARKLFF